MSRSHQWIGLNKRAEAWLEENGAVERVGRVEMVDDAFGQTPTYPLREWEIKGNVVVREYIQHEPWSSGPMSFTALKYYVPFEPVEESLWVLGSPDRSVEFDREAGIVRV